MAWSHRMLLPLVVAFIAGCGAPEAGPPVLKLATWFGSTEAKELTPIVAAINARHAKEFRIEAIPIPGEYLPKIDTMMAGKLAPDLFLLSQEYLPSYAAIGAVLDLDAKIKADPRIDLPDYYPAGLSTARFKGHLYGLPWVMMPVVLYYNRTIFDKAKLAYPDPSWDWARFRTAAKQLTVRDAAGNASQWGFLQSTWPPYMIWVWQNGGDVLSADGLHPTLTQPATIEALTYEHQLLVEDQVSPPAGTIIQNGASEMFKSGRIGMFFGGASDDLDRAEGMQVGVTELPHGKQRATFSWTAHMVISSQTKHPDEAYVAWGELLDGLHHWKIVPPRRSLAKDLAKLEPRKAGAAGPILASMEYARGLQGVVPQTDWDDFALNRLILPLVSGRAGAKEAAETTQAKLERLMETTR
ncbi:MAG: sugar transporter sugar-binding protein [Cyanobacteria bacterium RYN_339]|nr:sugar transporter sugar-binding protein [Cyanobacteria bacterium RYN_339]